MPAPTGLKKPPTFDHLKKKQPLQRVIVVPLDEDAVAALEEASEAAETARMTSPTGEAPPEVLEALNDAQKAVEKSSVKVLIRSIGRKRYDALLAEHPVTPEQTAEAEAEGGSALPYNIDTFPIALVAASCVSPEMTEEQVAELFDEWNAAEVNALWLTALEVNTQRRVVDLGKG